MEIAICDDNVFFVNDIKQKLMSLLPSDTVYKTFLSGNAFLEAHCDADFLFLDIEMPGIDGIELMDILSDSNSRTHIIYMTNYDERMREAFGNKVIGFLSKPVDIEQLKIILNKMNKLENRKYYEFDFGTKHIVVPIEDILFIDSDDKYTYINTRDNERYCVRKSMKEWVEYLPQNLFCRINRSYIVNFELCEKNLSKIHLPGNKIVEVSRINKEKVKKSYTKYLLTKTYEG